MSSSGSLKLSAALQPKNFATQEEGEREGLILAKKWIDDGKPKLRERGTGPGVA